MDFVVGDVVRYGFGFANPNHAAAAICALFPFCWGWGGAAGVRALPARGALQWCGRVAGVALCVMLAMTYSRAGMAVLAMEAAVLWWCEMVASKAEAALPHPLRLCSGRRWNAVPTIWGIILTVCLACVAAWWMWPRLALDGAVMNRPKIWLAGLRLFAANPLGVGFGNSGEIASAFMLPDGITVRTLVNSHLTLLVEMGVFVGGAWLAFIALALCVGWRMRRTWVSFAGLAVSAFSSSVFDWHVLFDFAEKGGYGAVNFALAWALFAAFVVMGVAMMAVWGRRCFTQRCGEAEGAESFRLGGVRRRVLTVAGVTVGICAVVVGFRSDDTPRVEGEYVVCGRRWNAVPTDCGVGAVGAIGSGRVGARVPCVYRDEGWSLKAVAKRFPDGARFCIRPGVPENAEDAGEVWLFGDTAESAWRFKGARLKLVDPPEFFDPPTNAVVLHVSTRSTRLITNAESQSR